MQRLTIIIEILIIINSFFNINTQRSMEFFSNSMTMKNIKIKESDSYILLQIMELN